MTRSLQNAETGSNIVRLPEIACKIVRQFKPVFRGKMATFRIIVLVSKTEIRSRELSVSSRSLRMLIINLNLVSIVEIVGHFFSFSSRSMIKCQKFSV